MRLFKRKSRPVEITGFGQEVMFLGQRMVIVGMSETYGPYSVRASIELDDKEDYERRMKL